jgi:hypothetical protein
VCCTILSLSIVTGIHRTTRTVHISVVSSRLGLDRYRCMLKFDASFINRTKPSCPFQSLCSMCKLPSILDTFVCTFWSMGVTISPNATDLDGKQILTLHNTTSLYHTAFYSVGVGSSDGVFIVFWMVYREMDVIHVRHCPALQRKNITICINYFPSGHRPIIKFICVTLPHNTTSA